MLRYRTGAASTPAAGQAMARYLASEALKPENPDRARYYMGERMPEPINDVDRLGQAVAEGTLLHSEALDQLMRQEMARGTADLDAAAATLAAQLSAATARSAAQDRVAGNAEMRRDTSPKLAERLGIRPADPLHLAQITNLLNGLRADAGPIAGKQVQAPMRSVVQIFGLDGERLPTPDEIDQVLAGRTVTGEVPKGPRSAELSPATVQGARRRFLAAYGMPAKQEPTPEQIDHIKAGRTVTGAMISLGDVLAKLNATKAPIAYADLVWSADKTVSVAWALAPTEAERAMILTAHRDAVNSAMKYVEERIGFARKGKAGRGGIDRGAVTWMTFHHYTSRPTAQIDRTDAHGTGYTVNQEVPLNDPDPQLHTHATLLNAVMSDNGRIGSLDLDSLDGLVKEFGAVYQAFVARNLRQHGIQVALDRDSGAARIIGIPAEIRRHFSKRTEHADEMVRKFAAEQGRDWDAMTPSERIGLLRRGAEASRLKKANNDGESDFVAWRRQADELGYQHRSVLRPDEIAPEPSEAQRRHKAYEVSLPLVEEAFAKRAKINAQELREFAARGLVEGGIQDPGADIAAITRAYRERGVRQEGEQVALIWGNDVPVRGKERLSVTTTLHESAERELINLAGHLGVDPSAALAQDKIERAVSAFLDAHSEIDRNGTQWQRQREAIYQLGTGGRLGVLIGVAGSGKTTVLTPLVDALRAEGRQVYGAALSWRQTEALGGAGIDANDRASIDAFLKRVDRGKYGLDRNTTLIIDEIGQVGRRQMLDILRLQQLHGMQVLAVGDPKQNQAIEAPAIELLREALGPDKVPEILSTVRQRTERERTIAGLFREGQVGKAIAMKREDQTAILVPGDREATVERIAQLWRQRTELRGSEAGFRLSISAPTNTDVNAIGGAIRQQLRQMGLLGEDQVIIASKVRGEEVELALAVGDRLRVFDRIHSGPREVLASNGDVIEVRELSAKGMVARNDEGHEAFVAWDKRDRDSPVRLAYGWALTVDTSQGITSTEHIDALPSGSQASQAFRGYVAESRHRERTWMVINEAAERRQISQRFPFGRPREIRESDVWENIEANLSRRPLKASALEFLRLGTELRRGSIIAVQRGNEPGDRREREGKARTAIHRHRDRLELERTPIVQQILEQAQALQQRALHRFTSRRRGHTQGPGISR